MVSTFTPNKNIEQPAHNDYVNTWDVPVNADWLAIDKAFGSSVSKNATGLSGNVTLAVADYTPLTIIITGLPTAAITYVVPSGVGGQWVFANATTGGFNVGIKSNAGGTTIVVPAGQNTLVSCDGSATGMRLSITTTPVAAGSNTQVQFNASGLLSASAGMTFDGTTLAVTGFNNTGNTVLGDNAGDALTITGTNVAIPNNLNFDGSTFFIDATNNRVGIGTNTPANPLSVAGNIQSMSGGYIFPDSSTQTTAFNTLFNAVTQNVSGVTSVDFTVVPATANNLAISLAVISGTPGVIYTLQYYINGVLDTTANYFSQAFVTIGASSASSAGAPSTFCGLGQWGSFQVTGNIWINDIKTTNRVQYNAVLTGVDPSNSQVQWSHAAGGRQITGGVVTGFRFSTLGPTFSGRLTMVSTV